METLHGEDDNGQRLLANDGGDLPPQRTSIRYRPLLFGEIWVLCLWPGTFGSPLREHLEHVRLGVLSGEVAIENIKVKTPKELEASTLGVYVEAKVKIRDSV